MKFIDLRYNLQRHGFPDFNPENGFSPKVSAALKGKSGHKITNTLQRSGVLASAALQIMHPDLYWAGIETQVKLSEWAIKYQLHDMYHHLKHWTSVFNVLLVICNQQTTS